MDPDEYRDMVPADLPAKNLGKPAEFSHKAVLRQVNYVQETPIKIDYSMFDKLANIQQSAQRDGLVPSNQTFQKFVHKMRMEHLKTLMIAFEKEKSLKALALKNTEVQDEEESKTQAPESMHLENLKRIAGFFAISLSLHHNLKSLFPMASLKEMWDVAQISLQKGIEQAMNTSKLDEMMNIKEGILLFSLCVQD